MATEITPEMIAIIERVRGLLAGDPRFVGASERWRRANPTECIAATFAFCDEGAALLAQLPVEIQEELCTEDRVSGDLLAILAGRAEQ